MTYRELQAALKEYGKRCQVRRNSATHVLAAELARLQETEATPEEKVDNNYSINELRCEIKKELWPTKPLVKLNSSKQVLIAEYLRILDLKRANQAARETNDAMSETERFIFYCVAKLVKQGYNEELALEIAQTQAEGTPEERTEFLLTA